MLKNASKIPIESGKFRRAGKRFTLIAAFLALAFIFSEAHAQEKSAIGGKRQLMPEKKQMMEQMMKDPSMMNMMMDKIASDQHMRMTMMDKMMTHVEGDTASMMSMCKHMMKHKVMMSMMMKMMMGSGMNGQGGMMEHRMMKKSPADTTMSGHEAHHKNQ